MNHVRHPHSNFTFKAPEDMPNCDDLAVVRGHIEGNQAEPVIMSYWKPTAEDLAMLNAGGHVRLSIFGNGMPPVSLSTVDEALTTI